MPSAVANGLDSTAHGSVFINEIHYDNVGGDTGEVIEVAGAAGQDLSDWSIILYNGSDGSSYNTIALGGTIPNQENGFGTLFFEVTGIQNGPDAMALVDSEDQVIQFLSYEGSFAAKDGTTLGLMSTDIGVAEDSGTSVGCSLQLFGSGREYEDFSWTAQPISNTCGQVNTGQTFVPIPGTAWLLGPGVLGLTALRRRKG